MSREGEVDHSHISLTLPPVQVGSLWIVVWAGQVRVRAAHDMSASQISLINEGDVLTEHERYRELSPAGDSWGTMHREWLKHELGWSLVAGPEGPFLQRLDQVPTEIRKKLAAAREKRMQMQAEAQVVLQQQQALAIAQQQHLAQQQAALQQQQQQYQRASGNGAGTSNIALQPLTNSEGQPNVNHTVIPIQGGEKRGSSVAAGDGAGADGEDEDEDGEEYEEDAAGDAAAAEAEKKKKMKKKMTEHCCLLACLCICCSTLFALCN